MTPSIYINLEDDVTKIVTRLKHQSAKSVVLVCPKRCFLFNDSINLRLLKKQVDLLGKEVFILTMDERGQLYAQEAGFQLKFLPKINSSKSFSDIKRPEAQKPIEQAELKLDLTNPVTTVEPEKPLEEEKVFEEIEKQVEKIVAVKAPLVQSEAKEALSGASYEAAEKLEEILPGEPVKVTESFFPQEIEKNYADEPKKSHSQKVIFAIVAASIILVLLLGFVILPKAEVVVFPKTEALTRDMDISISTNVTEIDTTKLAMAAVKVEETVNVSDKFQSQGKNQVGNKASGTVKIYNFTKQPINLKAATTILTVGSKTYNLVEDITGLKPTTYINSRTKEVDEKSLGEPVAIIATQGGDDYNLPAGTRVEITNKVFGSNPQLLYAKSDSEISGGTTRFLSVIAQSDLADSQKQLEAKALKEVRDKLETSGLILADGAYSEVTSGFSTDSAVGTETPSFQGSLQAQITGLAFKKEDLSNLIFQRISQTLASNKTLQLKQPDQTAFRVKSLDMNNQLATLSVHFEGQAVFNVDLANIAPELVGKTQSQVNEILNSRAEIEKVEITLAPVWQKNFPYFASKIKLKVQQQASDSQ